MSKDYQRINDIIEKSKGDENRENVLAKQMSEKITDANKAMNRAYIAVKNFERYDMGKIFLDRAVKLDSGLKDLFQYRDINYDIYKGLEKRKNKKGYDDHIKNIGDTMNKDGIFYNIGIPTLHHQTKNNKDVKAFNYALRRITQMLVNQQHIYIDPLNYDEKMGRLTVRCYPNFTYPKIEVRKAIKQYPILLANHLNQIYGNGTVVANSGVITFMKDVDYKKLVVSVLMADAKHDSLPKVAENKNMTLKDIKGLIKEQIKKENHKIEDELTIGEFLKELEKKSFIITTRNHNQSIDFKLKIYSVRENIDFLEFQTENHFYIQFHINFIENIIKYKDYYLIKLNDNSSFTITWIKP